MARPSTSSEGPTQANVRGYPAAEPPGRPSPDRVRCRLEAILAEMRAEPKMAWDFSLQLLYQKIFPDMTHFLPQEEGERYRADFEKEWLRLATA
ncbi:MAG: hypothetical protein WBS22_08585 [Methylocystis sp.]